MDISRRLFLSGLLSSAAAACLGQGMATHKTAAQPRGKFSGLPFSARFSDIAAQAGLHAPTIYGNPDHDLYILETLGCGCAFLDYDNDGWLDVFLLSGTRLPAAPAGASNRLFKNNRDGTFTDVTEKRACRKPRCGSWWYKACAPSYSYRFDFGGREVI